MVKIAGHEYPTPLVVGGVVGVVVLVAGQRLLGSGTPEAAVTTAPGDVAPTGAGDVGQFPVVDPSSGASYDWWDDGSSGFPTYPPAPGPAPAPGPIPSPAPAPSPSPSPAPSPAPSPSPSPTPATAIWWPAWIPKPPSTATFALHVPAGTRFNQLTSSGTYVHQWTTANGFTAYGNSLKRLSSGARIGKLITGAYLFWVNTSIGTIYLKP